jgi:radical SAM superfamily enzyme YgiQ (UPF0313 family)
VVTLPAAQALRAPGGVLLVSCYDLGRRPVAVASACEALQRAGFQPALRDLAVEKLDEAELSRARLVLTSVPMHTALRLGVRVAERARKASPGVHVAMFGLYAALNRPHLLGRHCDAIVGGESDAPLVALTEALAAESAQHPDAPLASLPLAPVAAASTQAHPAAQAWKKGPRKTLQAAPGAGAALPQLGRYALLEIAGEKRLVATVEASRGCKHLCRHCPVVPVYQGRFVAVPQPEVLAQLAPQLEAGARHVTFADPDFLNGPTHALRLATALHERWPEVTFDATVKIEHLLEHRALLPALAQAGCLFVTSAVESLSDRVLAALAKGHTNTDVAETLAAARAAGIDVRPTLLPFTPWTALADLPALFAFAEEHGLIDQIDPVQYTLRLLLPPGSPLLLEDGRAPAWLGAFDAERFTYGWVHDDPRVDALQRSMAALAERHAEAARPPRETFEALRALAHEAAGLPVAAPLAVLAGQRTAPRLSEPWFC